jgi:hypothetical protein
MKLFLAYRLRDTVRIISCEIILGLPHNSKQRVLTLQWTAMKLFLAFRLRDAVWTLSCEFILGLPRY